MARRGEFVRVYAELDGMPYNAQRAFGQGAIQPGEIITGTKVYFTTYDDLTVTLAVATGSTVQIRWGDGTTSTVVGDDSEHGYAHEYVTQTSRLARLVGDVEDVLVFNLSGQDITMAMTEIAKMPALVSLDLGGTSGISGDLRNLSGLTDALSITLGGVDDGLVYTAGDLPAWAGTSLDLSTCKLLSPEVDNFIINLASGIGAAGVLLIGDTNGTRTPASDAAYLAFYAAGWVLACNQLGATFIATNDFSLKMTVSAGNVVFVDWGDLSWQEWVADGTEKTVAHDYATSGTYLVRISEDLSGVTTIDLNSQTTVGGSLSDFSYLTSLTALKLYQTGFNDSINHLQGLINLQYLHLAFSGVTGNISALAYMTQMQYLYIYNTSLTGNTSSLSAMSELLQLYINNTAITGTLISLLAATDLAFINAGSTSLIGNIAALSSKNSLSLINLSLTTMIYTYPTTLPSWGGNSITINSCGLSSAMVDNFLIDFADGIGTAGTLNIGGTNAVRTSASDAAVATILSAGWVLTVNDPA